MNEDLPADGKYLYLRPTGLLTPDQLYLVKVEGNYYTGGMPIGNLTLFGSKTGTFSDTLGFKVQPVDLAQLPVESEPDRVSALEGLLIVMRVVRMASLRLDQRLENLTFSLVSLLCFC